MTKPTEKELDIFEEKNLSEIIRLKCNECVKGVHFVYISHDLQLKLGRSQEYGQQIARSYGGYAADAAAAKQQINYIRAMRRQHK